MNFLTDENEAVAICAGERFLAKKGEVWTGGNDE
jgi:hypothetical protein